MKNTVTKDQIKTIIDGSTVEVQTVLGKCTVVTCQLPNGFIIVESSACVDPANYDEKLGAEICLKRIENKVWELEGYKLQSEIVLIDDGGYSTKDLADMNAEFGFDFAICLLKEGEKIARKGWNGKGMFVYYVPANSYPTTTAIAKSEFGEVAHYNPYLAIRTVQGPVSTWVPSINDCLANDWMIIK
jgi:hypothetical protein